MVKCVVSRCPNRMMIGNRGAFSRPAKRFFNFPRDPTRVKVWLAALRETQQQDSSERHIICEDHFLPQDISTRGIGSDAIPIMPPHLDGPLGLVSPWGAASSSEEEEEDEWVTGDCEEEEEEEEEEECGDDPASQPPQQAPGGGLENPPNDERTSASLQQSNQIKQPNQSKKGCRQDVSLGLLTLRFLELLLAAPDGALDLRDVASSLQTRKRRVYDITHVLNGFNLIEKDSTNWIKWIGKSPISSFLWRNPKNLWREVENLKHVEEQLDALIRSCARQLFSVTDNVEDSASAYVTLEDISRFQPAQQQTVILVKAPEETTLQIPTPQESRVQIYLKAVRSPITVLTCEVGSDAAESSGSFLPLEESRIRTSTLHTAAGPRSAPQGV